MQLQQKHINLLLYMGKCVTAAVLIFIIQPYLPESDITWLFISILLVLTPDSNEALPNAIIRIKANLIASMVSLVLVLTHIPLLPAISIAFCITIILCYLLDIMLGSRPALAAVVIIMLHAPGHNIVELAFTRALYVVIGCVIGLLLTLIFHRRIRERKVPASPGGE